MYDKDYYEHGLEKGISCYQNYVWLPERTMSFAMRLIDYLRISPHDTVLDVGCAKGYLVRAFRLLHRRAFGFDTSSYALSCVPEDTRKFCFSYLPRTHYEFCIAKDVFEHLTEDELIDLLKAIRTDSMFVVVPFGEDGVYRSKVNNLDVTHKLCMDEDWWSNIFKENRFNVIDFNYEFYGCKDHHPIRSHGFYYLRKRYDI